ncbi:MAG: 5'-nucleotidase C-terminal domain-containing protein, partial [Myxococcales bacterium]|nr:5'-nucleotidase C-terminal domain-containing protein [Myxococcales bacterium]
TNDLHGHVWALPWLAGYLEVLREARREDGAVVLLDGGDMFQGTLESNLLEGAPIVTAYDALRYDAVTIGNHEFDYGPVGERVTPTEPGDDPRGALLARAAQAHYPFLAANLRVRGGAPIAWEHVQTATILERAGVSIGVIGVTTEQTLSTTNAANVSDLAMAPIVRAVTEQARALRGRGADIVLVAAHAGGRCTEHDDPTDLSSCEADQEIFEVARALPEGTVDAIVAGHTHQAVSHVVNGIPIIESYSYGRAFGRVDLVVDRTRGVVTRVEVHPPRDLCASGSIEEGCEPGTYEGRPVAASAEVAALVQPSIENAAAQRAHPLGVTIAGGPIEAVRERECALGNLFTDLMRQASGADVALTNGGGLRADLPEGPLTYGQLYQASPFDNAFAMVRLSRAELEAMIADNLGRTGSFLSLSGVRAVARCEGGRIQARITRDDGRPIPDDATLTLATTDFLATGTEASFASLRERDAVTIDHGSLVREAMARVLEERGGQLTPGALYDPATPRVRYEGTRPVSCPR